VAVVSHSFWKNRWGGDPDVVGSTVYVSRQPYTAIGIAPEGFGSHFALGNPDVYVPLMQGGFKESSQHLREELRWRQGGVDERIELYVDRCVHQVVRRRDAASIGRGSGKESLVVCRARRQPWQLACPLLSGDAGFANLVVCDLRIFVLCRGGTSRSWNEKRSPFFELAVVECAPSLGNWTDHHRRSLGSCGGTQRLEVAALHTGPRPLSGTPIDERHARRLPNWRRTAN
jgi:hypothetical protein